MLTAWAYVGSTTCLAVAIAVSTPMTDWLAPLPAALMGPLAFWVVMCSVVAYFAVTSATRYLQSSQVCGVGVLVLCAIMMAWQSTQVAAYQCVQPLFGTTLAVLVLGERATWFDVGAVGVVGGLLLVTYRARGE